MTIFQGLEFTKIIILMIFFLGFAPTHSNAEQVFRCKAPQGVAMYSIEGHKVSPDGFKGVEPIVIIDDKKMTIVWGDSASAGGTEKVWNAVIFHRSPETISAVALDGGDANSAAMMYTLDVKRGYLYFSVHKESSLLNSSSGATFVSKCSN